MTEIRVTTAGLLPGDEVIRVEGSAIIVYREHVDVDGDPCCAYTETDCCDRPRPTCETVTALDSNGDPDVVVCRMGEGCDHDRYWTDEAREVSDEPAV